MKFKRREVTKTALTVTENALKYSNLAQPYLKPKQYRWAMLGLKLLHGVLLIADRKEDRHD